MILYLYHNSKKIERNKLEDPNEIKVLVVELEVEGTAFDFKNMDENGFKGIYKDEFLENFKEKAEKDYKEASSILILHKKLKALEKESKEEEYEK